MVKFKKSHGRHNRHPRALVLVLAFLVSAAVLSILNVPLGNFFIDIQRPFDRVEYPQGGFHGDKDLEQGRVDRRNHGRRMRPRVLNIF